MNEEYLSSYQKIVYNTFLHALRENKLSHAYLIKGNEGAPLLETAKFLAKSLICEDPTPFACDKCLSCMRFDDGNYPDYMLLDGSKANIRVSDIEELQNFFQNTSQEKCGKMVYIIHLLENSNKESLNAILKFLEEPGENVYAFITTFNEERLLPTILSRCQHLKLLPLPDSDIIALAEEKGISEDDAELLSSFYGNADTIVSIASSENYIKVKDAVFDTLDALMKSREEALYFVQKEVIPSVKEKGDVRLYLDILSLAFKDIISASLNLPLTLKNHERLLVSLVNRVENPQACYTEIMLSRGKIELNVNAGLLLEHVFITVLKGGK